MNNKSGIVSLLNNLSDSITEFVHNTKNNLVVLLNETKNVYKIDSQSAGKIELNIKEICFHIEKLVLNSKAIFKDLKQKHETFLSSLIVLNSPRIPNELGENKISTSFLRNESHATLFSTQSMNNILTFRSANNAPQSKNDTQLLIEITDMTLTFITKMKQLQESIINKDKGVHIKKKEFEILKNHLEKKIRAIKKDSTEAFQEYNIKNELIEKLQKENVNLKIQLLKNNATFLKKHLEIVSCENFSIMNKQKIKEKSLVKVINELNLSFEKEFNSFFKKPNKNFHYNYKTTNKSTNHSSRNKNKNCLSACQITSIPKINTFSITS